MSEYYAFDCGCKFPILDKGGEFPKIDFALNLDSINLECQRTWDLISAGNTKGVFQLESRLGHMMAKKLKPENIDQLSALIAVLRPGCISGDTKISVSKYLHKDGRIRQKLIKMRDLYRKQDSFRTLLSYDERNGTIISNQIKNIVYNGQKECFRVIVNTHSNMYTTNGTKQYRLECTDDHKLLTSTGWKELKDIKQGDRVLVNKRKNTRQSELGDRSFRSRCYHAYKYKCIFCNWKDGSLDVNHVVENRHNNNEPKNLCFMCPNHHRQFTEGSLGIKEVRRLQKKHKLPKTIDGKWATVVDKISVGIKDVYDISMEAPHHNFIAGDIIVHNCLEAMRDGKSVTNHYIDKKNGQESIDYFHSALEPILNKTYGEMIYQEQAMQIAKTIAGFSLKDAEHLRKAIGKKKPEEMVKLKKLFTEGCKKQKLVNDQDAEQIFGWIEKGQRYSFNASHSVSYSINAYLSAYAKAHFPRIFFASYLKFAKDKIDPQQEIKELVRNANEMDILVKTPDFRKLNRFFILQNKDIYFGLTDIKGVGESVFNKIIDLCKDLNVNNMDWLSTLFNTLININSIASKALISCGAFDHFKKNRTEMLFEYDICSSLTKKEIEKLYNIKKEHNISDLKILLRTGLAANISNKKRITVLQNLLQSIQNPPYSLIDKIEWLSDSENSLLGVSITCSKLDSYDIEMTNTDCKTFKNSIATDNIIIAGEITNINIVKTKTGKNPGQEMSFISIEDQTGFLDSVIMFPEQWLKFKSHIFVGNVLIFVGNKAKNKDGLIVEKCFAPKA
jgi:DNA polymerase III alpha subunit